MKHSLKVSVSKKPQTGGVVTCRNVSVCEKLSSLNLSSFKTEKVKSMTKMFSGCSELASLDLKKFDTSTVTDMNGIKAKETNSQGGWDGNSTTLPDCPLYHFYDEINMYGHLHQETLGKITVCDRWHTFVLNVCLFLCLNSNKKREL